MIEFSLSDVTNDIDQETRDLIADLVLSWARYDSLVTHWTFRSFGMGPDAGSILLGNMDTKTKFDRMRALNSHYGMTEAVTAITDLSKLHKAHVDVRNIICHKSCAGHSRSDPNRLIFANAKVYPGKPGKMLVELVHLDQIRSAIQFAKVSADKIADVVDALIAQLEELKKPSDEQRPYSPPIPQP